MIPSERIGRHPDAIEAEVDGQRVIMSPQGYRYFGLEGAGAAVWDRIVTPMSIDELVNSLTKDFDADDATVRSEVEEFLAALDAVGLITTESGGS